MPKNKKGRSKRPTKRQSNLPASQHSNFGVFDTKAFVFNDIVAIPCPQGVGPLANFVIQF
jgi:hypothetical protein